MYLTTTKPSIPAGTKAPSPDQDKQSLGIMAHKIIGLLHLHKSLIPKDLLAYLNFIDEEINSVNESTMDQWQCEDWYIHKQGFLSASKYKIYCIRQNTIGKGKFDGFCKLAEQTVTVSVNIPGGKRTMLLIAVAIQGNGA